MTHPDEVGQEWSGPTTSDEAVRSCGRSDRLLMMFLGKALALGTIRLVLILLVVCIVGASLTEFLDAA